MTGDAEAAAAASVKRWLRDAGVDEARVAEAERRDQLHLLVAERITVPDPPQYTARELCALVGVDLEQFRALWASFGFPRVDDDDETRYTQADVEAFTNLVGLLLLLGLSDSEAAAITRVVGSATSRVAEAGLSSIAAMRAGVDDATRAERFLLTADAVLPGVSRLLEYAWRHHAQVAARRVLLAQAPPPAADPVATVTIGFADLVGFTALSQQLSPPALEELTTRFTTIASTVVHRDGGRIVKMIGDEVMFLADDALDAIRIGLALVDVVAQDELLTEVKVGIATGPVLAREGDYYGPAVNTASRIVGITRPGSVVVTEAVREAGRADPAIRWRDLRRCYLRDIGWVRLWAARPSSASRRSRPVGLLTLLGDWHRQSLENMAALRGRVG